jgi:glucose-6-phosphate-specific signal transduction histidine kinase
LFAEKNRLLVTWRDPRSLSLQIFWLVYPVHALLSFARNYDQGTNSLYVTIFSLLGPTIGLVPFYFAHRKILRALNKSSVRHTLGTYIFMGVIDGVFFRVLFSGQATTPSELILAVLINAEFVVIAFSTTAYVKISIQNLIATSQNQEARFDRSIKNLDDIRRKYNDERLKLKDILETRIIPVLHDVENAIRNLAESQKPIQFQEVSQNVQAMAIEPIREISHQYAVKKKTRSRVNEVFSLRGKKTEQTWNSLGYVIKSIQPPSYLAAAVLFIIFITIEEGDCRPRNLIMNAILFMILALANLLSRTNFFSHSSRPTYLTLFAIFSASSIWVFISNSPSLSCTKTQTMTETTLTSIGIGIIILVSGIFSQLVAEADEEARELESEIAKNQSEYVAINSDLNTLRKKVSEVMHGTVIGRLAAITLMLKDFSTKNDNAQFTQTDFLQNKVIPSMQNIESELLSLLQANNDDKRDVLDEIEKIVEYWRGLIEVEYQISPRLVELDKFKPPQISLSAICQELIANANRHANARSVTIEIELNEEIGRESLWSIRICCRDDGKKDAVIRSGGIGLAPITSAGGTWKITHLHPSGNIVDIEFPYFVVS